MKLWEKHNLPKFTGEPPMAMDYCHVELLRDAILKAKPSTAVEIGSYQGHSTVAFLEAMKQLPDMQFHVFELHMTPELQRITQDNPRVHVHLMPVWKSQLKPDFVFIDGDHGLPALADLAFCLAREVPTIAMHDTNSFTEGLTPDGSETAANLLKSMPSRKWREDKTRRDGLWTHRGFGVSELLT